VEINITRVVHPIGPPASPEPNPWKLTELLLSIHSWRLPPKQWPTWPVQEATNCVRKIWGCPASRF
jgi:hypothetical protein